jgi:putative DNA primase/helicase
MALQVQEPTLRSFFARSDGLARGTGFLARFLVAWPISTQGQRPFSDPPDTWPALEEFNHRITAILEQDAPIDNDGALSPPIFSLVVDTKLAWVTFHDAIESELSSGGELYDVRDVASKTADNAARIATLLHVFEHGACGSIGLEAFEGASRIAAWHLHEARRFYGELALPEELVSAAQLDEWLLGYCNKKGINVVSNRDIQRLITPGYLRKKPALEKALTELVELGRVRVIKNGRHKDIHVNPALLESLPQ